MKRTFLTLGPVAAVIVIAAVLVAVSSAGANRADTFALDMDPSGNTATSVGTIDECAEASPGDSIQVDFVVIGAPPFIGYIGAIGFDDASMQVASMDTAGLLSTAPGYTEFNASDDLPDTASPFQASVADLNAAGASGDGFLARLTVQIDPDVAPGGYALTLDPSNASIVDPNNNTMTADTVAGGRIAVGVTCESLPTPSPTPPPFKKGDVDCSGGDVNSVDALKVLRKVAGLPVDRPPQCPEIGTGTPMNGDMNCDSQISSVDALLILRHVAGLQVNLPGGCPPIGS